MNIQRLRNLTTGRLHTKIEHVYEDLATITAQKGLMTHILPRVNEAIQPWLRENAPDPRLWNGELDTTHTGEFDLPQPTTEDRAAMFSRFKELN